MHPIDRAVLELCRDDFHDAEIPARTRSRREVSIDMCSSFSVSDGWKREASTIRPHQRGIAN